MMPRPTTGSDPRGPAARRAPSLAGAQLPPALERLDDAEAVALGLRFGQDLGSAERSDAPDWESYEERMGFIFMLLRSHQCDPALFELPPGTPDTAPAASGRLARSVIVAGRR